MLIFKYAIARYSCKVFHQYLSTRKFLACEGKIYPNHMQEGGNGVLMYFIGNKFSLHRLAIIRVNFVRILGTLEFLARSIISQMVKSSDILDMRFYMDPFTVTFRFCWYASCYKHVFRKIANTYSLDFVQYFPS